jgi:acetyl-CoA carboxylase carboxyl transferase subunit alpha
MIDESAFEAPLAELRARIEELEGYPAGSGHEREIERLQRRLRKDTRDVFKTLTPWQVALVARHSDRPYTLDYVARLMTEWIELHGDRAYSDDPAVVAGLAEFRGRRIALVGHQKGRGTTERIRRNFGQPRPEGYRKALRVMKLAERFGLPIVSLIDTPGAYPGVGAEERGQAEAIARNLIEMAGLRVPVVVVVTGEGGSGGALALGVGNFVAMLEHSVYSVITPEGCAAILWKDQEKRAQAASAMRITADDLLRFAVVDEVIPEPVGGAHTDHAMAAENLGAVVERALNGLAQLPPERLVSERRQRFRRLGVFSESR